MDTTSWLIAVDISSVLLVIYVLDRNVFRALDLLTISIPTAVAKGWFLLFIRIRLWFDRQALIHRGPVGRLWNEYSLWKIRTNPAYKEFFENRE